MSRLRIVCLGEAMVELSLDRDHPETARIGFAGDTLNTAIYLKRMAGDAEVAYATKIGSDQLSDRMLSLMASEGLATHLVHRSPNALPGLYAISTDERGERSFQYWRDTSAARRMFEAPGLTLAELAEHDVLYFSAISLAILPPEHRRDLIDWLPDYRARGGRVAFDSNYRPALWPDVETARTTIAETWRRTDIGLPSLDDEMALFGDDSEDAAFKRLRDYGLRTGALKRGEKGPHALSGEPAGPFDPAQRMVDSTAAGDSFNGAYLAAHLSGLPEADCLQAGHQLACRVIGLRGAIIPREEVVPA